MCVCQKLPARNYATIVINACNHRQCWNQNGATIVKAIFFFCHYYIVWESNNAGEARGRSWSVSLRSRWIPGGSCGYTSGTKRKRFAALSSPRPCWRWLQLQPSCGSPQCSNLTKSLSSVTSLSIVQSIWKFAQSTTISLPCSVRNFKTTRLYTHAFLFCLCLYVLLDSCGIFTYIFQY